EHLQDRGGARQADRVDAIPRRQSPRGRVNGGGARAGAAAGADQLHASRSDAGADALAAQARTIAALQAEVDALNAKEPDWASVAARLEASVVTVETHEDLGSGWVARSSESGSDIVTNFHVVAAAVDNGENDIQVTQFDRTMPAGVERIDRLDDLAVLHVARRLQPLATAA